MSVHLYCSEYWTTLSTNVEETWCKSNFVLHEIENTIDGTCELKESFKGNRYKKKTLSFRIRKIEQKMSGAHHEERGIWEPDTHRT